MTNMTIRDFDPRGPHPLQTVLKRLAGPIEVVRKGGGRVIRQAPPAVDSAQASARRHAEPPIAGR
jgi:hypothetical protein